MNEPIFSMLSGKYPNGFVATGIPSDWAFSAGGDPNNRTYELYGDEWFETTSFIYYFSYETDYPCNCGAFFTRVSGWFFWSYMMVAFAPGSPGGAPPSSGWQKWAYSEDCSSNNISACGGGSQSISLTFTPV